MKSILAITLIFSFFLCTAAFANELTIYSSEGIKKIKIPEQARPQELHNHYRFIGEKCILNCQEEIPKSQPTEKTPAKEASDSVEKPGQSITINIYPNEPGPQQYIFVPYGRPRRDYRPPDHPKQPLRPSINPGMPGIHDRLLPK